MKIKYSKKEFNDYTHRFKVELKTSNDIFSLDIYSNSDSEQDLVNYINDKKSDKVLSFEIINKNSKEQDDRASIYIDSFLNNI